MVTLGDRGGEEGGLAVRSIRGELVLESFLSSESLGTSISSLVTTEDSEISY